MKMIAQEDIVAKSQELHQVVDELVAVIADAVAEHTPVHKVEAKTLSVLLRAGQKAIQLLVDCLGDGDVGQEHQFPDGTTLKRSEKPQPRNYVSIFGNIDIERYVYFLREAQAIKFVAIDARLALPASKFSYLLQDWDQSFAVEEPFGQTAKTIQRILGLKQYVDSLEHMNQEMAREAEVFQASLPLPPAKEEGEIFVQTADGKGVPIRRPADAPPIRDHEHRSGPKPDRKRMATVGAVYSIDRLVRTPEEVVESLFRDPGQPRPKADRPHPCHKQMYAMLDHIDRYGDAVEGRPAVFGWISDQMAARHAGCKKPIVCIMDGEESLWAMRNAFQEDIPMIDILDLLHVTPRLWTAAAIFHRKGSRAAEKFVRKQLLRILHGDVSGVVRGLRWMGTSNRLRGNKRTTLRKICGYLEKNRERMRYHEYLACGYPIASGVIEGACRHVVKDRLERTGMNWTIPGAEAMLELRCIHLTEQWDAFVEFRVAIETRRLYPYRDTLKTLAWHVAA
jgi:hypothetical protein